MYEGKHNLFQIGFGFLNGALATMVLISIFIRF
jgi:hypothetical protein